jgi:cyclopropane-fatty-acyl-phospholipid synthase
MSLKNIYNLSKIFEKADIGEITINTPDGKQLFFKGNKGYISCDLTIKNWQIMDLVAKRGDIGLGEAYHLDFWESSDVANFLTYCCLNIDKIKQHVDGNFFNRVIFYFYNHLVRLNTKRGSKKNILAHYDISNDFYQIWLDSSMTYSSAIRNNEQDSLHQAQLNKYHRIINKIDLQGKNTLEIGCGWGGFADEASNFGADVTGITISDKQYDFAKKRIGNKANILLQDYRDVKGKYDRIVSIEMLEAVGEKYWQTYFNQIKKSLLSSGKAVIQTITIDDNFFAQYRKNSDYIRHHVFPGGMLPSKSKFCTNANKARLYVNEIFEFGHDYAWTLRKWQDNIKNQKDKLLALNYSEEFLRAWDFYLSISIAGFLCGRTNVIQAEIFND